MIESLYIAETGMSSQQQLINTISNNIANVSTPGFKKVEVNFMDLVYKNDISKNDNNVEGTKRFNGAGVMAGSTSINFNVGDLKISENPYDLAIQGGGFFEVTLSDGSRAYTRDGQFKIDSDGYLTTNTGNRLSGDIRVAPDSKNFEVSPDGVVSVLYADDQSRSEIGQIELAQFTNTNGLTQIGNNLYSAKSESMGGRFYVKPGELGSGPIMQGMTEISNVSMTREMVNLMMAQRGYQLNARLVQVSDQILDTINNLRR